ncbi:cyclase family protein [Zophobihabitans entericus]|uniref:Cyclase family protein n=1 Tax=Zophobihabitans entericus TaxID=1635327 RepID=A0A6G9I9M4_9GAMM|nr:cyclase family protein [Zophobihabitans entericus]QIQ20921.1 cyclase family protein [Zophobihabitans entericus]
MIENLLTILNNAKVIDLSQTFEEGMPVAPSHPKFYQNEVDSIKKGDVSYLNVLTIGEHCGTHVDAQNHFVDDGEPIDKMPLQQLVGRGVVIDIAALPDNGVATLEMIMDWEKTNGKIRQNDIVLFYTGHEKYWALKPDYAPFMSNWRGLSREGAEYLRDIGVKAVGTDSMALDAFKPECGGYPAHDALLGANIPILENIANLKLLTKPFVFMAFPLKIKHGSASPLRAVAYMES